MFQFNSSQVRRAVAASAATLVFGLVGAGSALADGSASLPAYGGPGGSEQGTVDQGTTPPVVTTPCTEGQSGGGMTGGGTTGGGTTQTCAPAQTAPATQQPSNEVLGVQGSGGNAPASNNGNEVLGARAGGGTAPAAAAAPATASAPVAARASHRLVGSLPFTGLDLIMVATVGLVLLALGFGLRRLTTHPQVS